MSDLILHAYDASPFTQRALGMLALKGLAWRHVETPMAPPKDALVALTGGYRGTPVLQIGADVYVDTQRIAVELERRHPRPSFFPAGDAGFAALAVKWADSMFRAALTVAIGETSALWPEAFVADRQYLFPGIDFAAARRDHSVARAALRWHLLQLERQLADGRDWLSGAAPALIDVQVRPFVWMGRAYFPAVMDDLCRPLGRLTAWEARMAALGEGRRSPLDAAEALGIARAARPERPAGVAPDDPLGLSAGALVTVSPDDTPRGGVSGMLVALTPDEIAVQRSGDCGEVVVHFPRQGYRVDSAGDQTTRAARSA